MAPPLIQGSCRVSYKGEGCDESFYREGRAAGSSGRCFIDADSPEDIEKAAPSESEESAS